MLLDRVLPFPCTFLKYLFIFTDFSSGNSQKTVTSILAHVQFCVAGVRQCKYKTVFYLLIGIQCDAICMKFGDDGNKIKIINS